MTAFDEPIPESFGFHRTWSVTEVNAYVRDLMESDANLGDLWVEGEVSNVSRPKSGHVYFTLKDAESALRCVMWKNIAAQQEFRLEGGDAVEAHGNLSVYERRGQYQLYVDFLRPRGAGRLYQEYLRLKDKLEAEGLFAPEHKSPLPRWPEKIGLVTSPTGAALQDMLNTLRRRYPLVDVVLSPASVQGENAPPEIMAALKKLNMQGDVDLIIVGRGGGSIEDLWAFNDEGVARAIFDSQIPVISGVGHETDFTIADFVADVRAPTPTAAAELAVPDRMELIALTEDLAERVNRTYLTYISDQRWIISDLRSQIKRFSPQYEIRNGKQRVDELGDRLRRTMTRIIRDARKELHGVAEHLEALSPESILKRGYAVLTEEDGTVVYRVSQVEGGDILEARVADGRFDVVVKEN
ncbi:MAG: exodeoxyribonuclease VII large subunit [Anaerolineales bacterium]|nr:exodeoxyribonuclease VII large subunit [Anaerolineales bacterium]